MNYETICAENKVLYSTLEAITSALMELNEVRDAEAYNTLVNDRLYTHHLIEENLNLLFDIPVAEYGSVRKSRAANTVKRDIMKGKVIKHYMKHHSSLKEMSGVFSVSVYQISRYITEHLAQKHAF